MKGILVDFKVGDDLKRVFIPSHISLTFDKKGIWDSVRVFMKDYFMDKKVTIQKVGSTERFDLDDVTFLDKERK